MNYYIYLATIKCSRTIIIILNRLNSIWMFLLGFIQSQFSYITNFLVIEYI